MEISEFKNRIANPEGWYIFAGEEEYLARYYLGLLKNTVVKDEFLETFNYTVFDGPDIDFPALAEAISSPPMMSDYKLVVWKYADFERMKEGAKKTLDDLIELKNQYPYTVLAFLTTTVGFDVGNPPKRPSKLFVKLSRDFEILICRRSTDSQLLSWLKRHFDSEGISVNATTLNALIFRAGHEMDVLLGEVQKLVAYAKQNGKAEISPSDVELVSSSTVECDSFALSAAIQSGDKKQLFLALEELRGEKIEAPVILGMITKVYTEMLSVSFLLEEGKNSFDIAATLSVPEWKVQKEIPSVKRIGTQKLSRAIADLAALDVAMKSGTTSLSPLEMFLCQYI